VIVAVEKTTLLLSLPCDHVILDWRKKFSALKEQLSASLKIRNQEMPEHRKGL